MVDDLASSNKKHNEQLASGYDAVQAEDHQTEPESTSRLESELSNTLAEMFPASQSEDAKELQSFMSITDVGEKIKSRILEKGNDGKHRVSKEETDTIAKQVFQDETVKVYKHIVANEHFIFRENSSPLSQRTVDHLNGRIRS